MPFHVWGDDFDWAALNEACVYLERNCKRWARLGIGTKEKYGTLRVSTTCAYFTKYGFLHHIFYPGYIRYHWPDWFRRNIDWPVGKAIDKLGVLTVIHWWQNKVLKFFWRRAAKKWPHISEEILDEYEWMTGDNL